MYGTEEEQLCMNANSTGKEYPSVSPALRKLFKDEKRLLRIWRSSPERKIKKDGKPMLCGGASSERPAPAGSGKQWRVPERLLFQP